MSVVKKCLFSWSFTALHDSNSVWCFGPQNSDLRKEIRSQNQSNRCVSVVWLCALKSDVRFLWVCLFCCLKCRVLGCWVWPGHTVTRVIRFTRLIFFSHEHCSPSLSSSLSPSPPLPASFPFTPSLSLTPWLWGGHTLVPVLWWYLLHYRGSKDIFSVCGRGETTSWMPLWQINSRQQEVLIWKSVGI